MSTLPVRAEPPGAHDDQVRVTLCLRRADKYRCLLLPARGCAARSSPVPAGAGSLVHHLSACRHHVRCDVRWLLFHQEHVG